MKKWIILCALAAASLCALAACDAAPPSEVSSSQPSGQAAVPQEPPGLRLSVNEQQGDSIIQIPEFVSPGDNPEIDALNAKIYENHTKLYEEWKKTPNSVRELEIKSYSFADEYYVQAVVTQLEFPTYGTQGDIFSYNYDIKNHKVVTFEEILSKYGGKFPRSVDDVLAALVWNLPNNVTVERSEIQGFRTREDGTLDCYVKVYFQSANDRSENYNMLYTIHVDPSSEPITASPFDGDSLVPSAPSPETSSLPASASA